MKIITSKETAQQELAKLHAQLMAAGTQDVDTLVSSVVNNRTEMELARLITQDPKMLEIKRLVRLLAHQADPVMITGPSGTGKEIIARALHGARPTDKFKAINCAGMPEKLIESELFGHEAGAFTGANAPSIGLLRAAHNGTVFLDELAEAPAALQAKLLRVLQPDSEGCYHVRPVGGSVYHKINTRIVAATCADLDKARAAGTFRSDLYGRLMAFELHTTPLSERQDDILPILDSLGASPESDLYSPYWMDRIKEFNVRALQAYARRQKVYYAHGRTTGTIQETGDSGI